MLTCIATGTLLKPAQRRQSQKGTDFVTFTLRCPVEGDEAILASCIAFNSDVVEAVLQLGERDTAAVSGSAKLSQWESKDGQQHGINIKVDKLLTGYGVAKQRKAAREELGEQQP
jgi:hypothetical protein